MDITAERQSNVNGTGPVSSPQATAQAILEKLTRWQAAIEARLQTQMSLLEVLEEYLLVGLRTHHHEGNIDPNFIGTLLDTVLRRMIDQTPLVFDEEQDAPHRWSNGAVDPGFPAERLDVVIQTVEGTVSTFIAHYKDYLRRHWRMPEDDALLAALIREKVEAHMAVVDAVFQPAQLVGLDVDELRENIEALQDAWRQAGELTALATPREREILDAVVRSHVPHWLRATGEPERALLRAFEEQTAQAQASVDELLDGLGSLRAFARTLARDYVRHELDMEVEPDAIRVQLQWRTVIGQPTRTFNLSELLAAGPVRPDAVSVFLVENGAMLRNQPLPPTFVTRLLADVDAPAGYLQALSDLYGREDLKDAMGDWYMARLQQSAFIARCAGHLAVNRYEALKTLWQHAASASPAALRVACLVLPNALKCADLLLFYREDAPGEASDLLLYAPDKPDGQEWIELPSLRAVSAEIGGWIASEAGREYLLQKLAPSDQGLAREYFVGVLDKPTAWDLNADPRGAVAGLRACLGDSIAMGLANNLAQVELNESPRWYSALPLELRRTISSLSQELLVHEQVFNEQLAGYEVFVDFAKRTVTQAIAPYLRSKGVQEAVDPATVLIDYKPGLGNGPLKVASLLDLAIHGYDDNAGIDNPRKGVRSSVGQDLGQVRSAELALYIRRAYLGERYGKEIRARFLNVGTPDYIKRRYAYRNMVLTRMDRDLRVARGKSLLTDHEFWSLTRQVTLLSDGAPASGSVYPGAAVQRDGLIRFTLGGHIVLGVYVFTFFDPKGAYWLYTPDAPDGVTFRKYQEFSGRIAAQLQDYVLERVALSARTAVTRSLGAITAGTARVDTLREFSRVTDVEAEFDAYVERAITDVEDITTSRAEVIKNQVIKGLLFASAPVCMVYPPFALLLDIAFVAFSSKEAVEAHLQGDTQDALGRWLRASWGALFGVFGGAGIAALLGPSFSSLKLAVRPVSLSAQRLRRVTSVAAKEAGPMVRPIRFRPKHAVRKTPENLQWVTKEGIFQGTYLRPPTPSQPRSAYYIRSKGRYYQVTEHRSFGGLCLVSARRPGAIYKLPIRRMANGKWTRNEVGLRGGDDQVRYLGRVGDLREAFSGHVFPDVTRGALQGEAVVARFSEVAADNYLFSLNAQTCVIASLYNPTTKVGAVIHFDHNIRTLIERSVRDVMQRLGGSAKDVRATLVGGDWLTGADIGGRVRSVLRREGLQPTWDHWSYSSCLGNTYGVSLDLRSGVTSVFKTSSSQVERYYIPVLARAKQGADPVSRRARGFMTRLRSEPLVATANGGVHTLQGGRPATPAQIEAQAFPTVVLS